MTDILDKIDELIEDIDEVLTEAKFKKVIRKGKIKRKLFCPSGFKAQDGKCVKMKPEEVRKRKKATKRSAKKKKGAVLSRMLRKRKKSLKRRKAQIPLVTKINKAIGDAS